MSGREAGVGVERAAEEVEPSSGAGAQPPPRRTVIKFTRIPDEDTPRGTSKRTLPLDTGRSRSIARESVVRAAGAEKCFSNSQNLSRLSSVKKCEKEPKLASKIKSDDKNVSKSNVLYKRKVYSPESTVRNISNTPKTTTSSLATISDVKNNLKNNKLDKELSRPIDNKTAKEKENSKTSNKLIQKTPPKRKSFVNMQPKVDTFLKKKTVQAKISDTQETNKKKTIPKPLVSSPVLESVTPDSQSPPNNQKNSMGIPNSSENLSIPAANGNIEPSQPKAKPETKNQTTETVPEVWETNPKAKCNNTCEVELQTEPIDDCHEVDLRVPQLTLTEEIKEAGSWTEKLESHALPNLQLPPFKISPRGTLKKYIDEQLSSSGSRSTSIIIGEATVTYTQKKRINFQVVERSEGREQPTVSPYPCTVLGMLKKELHRNNEKSFDKHSRPNNKILIESKMDLYKWPEDLFSNKPFHKEVKLTKPSDVIRKMQNNSSMHDVVSLSEQFQKELNFIDSFFDSLQYLESNCLIVNKSLEQSSTSLDTTDSQTTPESLPVTKFNRSSFDKGEPNQMTANKSLCLLNLLIRDEHRRAKNLLLVLKMREDALKDFTKSQILWLENKKRNDQMDLSTLKKKQRGVLLKLQQECGEMQRMKKALLALSQRRKEALVQTKRNIELKLSTGVQVDRMLRNSKSLLRSADFDAKHSRTAMPVKCFDLSGSSLCVEDSPQMQDITRKEQIGVCPPAQPSNDTDLSKAEKCIQTGHSISENNENVAGATSSPHLVKVDGAYLNILFQNLAQPEIFSGGKDYEVNESALQNILKSSHRLRESPPKEDLNNKTYNQSETPESRSKSTSPSTARSLVDELDEYFHYLGNIDHNVTPDQDRHATAVIQVCRPSDSGDSIPTYKIKSRDEESGVESKVDEPPKEMSSNDGRIEQNYKHINTNIETILNASPNKEIPEERPAKGLKELEINTIDYPASKASLDEKNEKGWPKENMEVQTKQNYQKAVLKLPRLKQDSTNSLLAGTCGDVAVASPPRPLSTLSEEEELKKKQLAIELEIKALEQQQSLLLVREIPDKPPPPYTPPTPDVVAGTPPAPPTVAVPFSADKQRVIDYVNIFCERHYSSEEVKPPSDSLEELLFDFCTDAVTKYTVEQSEDPWHPANILPKRLGTDKESVKEKMSADACDALGLSEPLGLPLGPPILSKRSDYIDDILFTEWRRCETEWTALEADEIRVKNQVCNNILDIILQESISEFRSAVASRPRAADVEASPSDNKGVVSS